MDTQEKSRNGELFVRRRKLSRVMAMQFLYRCEVCDDWGEFPEDTKANYIELASALASEPDANFAPSIEDVKESWKYAMKLVKGVKECRDALDAYISEAAINWKFTRIGSIDRAILRIAVFEMIHMEKVKAATAIDEAVELAKAYGQGDSPRFVNGVLDKVRRMIEEGSVAEKQEEKEGE